MKKIAIYGLMALMSGAFVACDDYEEPNPPAQSNAQESILKVEDITVASALGEETYDLAVYNEENKAIEVATLTTSALPETFSLVAHVEISKKDENKWSEVTSEVVKDAENADLYHINVNADDLQGVYYANISKGPAAKDLDFRVRFATVIKLNTLSQEAYIGSPTYYYGPYSANVKPLPSDVVIEDAYYLVGTACDWTVSKAIKLNHSGENPYDDPVFTLAYTITEEMAAAGWWWKVIPASTFAAGDWVGEDFGAWGVAENGDDALEGMLAPYKDGVDPGAGCIKIAGQYLITFNMLEGTYSFTEAIPNFWTPGGSNGWNFADAKQLYTDNYSDYMGMIPLSGEFKMTSAADWSALYNLGYGGTEGTLANGSNDNIPVPANGLYWVTMSLPNLTYALAAVNTLGLIGDATPGGWDASTALTPSEDLLTWTGTVKMKGGEFKIRANDDWAINFGGAANALVFNAGNMPSPGEGTYDVTLSFAEIPYQVTFVKK
ncbi:MAG: hypothetical protein NC201_03110 [Prevotella sp.]|nr:hypothetical protein [Bacteroides sp.]MCM1366216.1 hypothetical protein [Prevotella sp.]MCM1436968.1 hypothetical protein [Prevotella sp.]